MDGSCTCRECNNFFIFSDKSFEITLETVYIRTERHHPIGVESLLYEFLFATTHVGETEINAIL
jgi:hypothetical protein